MVDQKLVDYIKDGLKKGYSKKELEEILRKNNWTKQELNDVFNIIYQRKDQPSSYLMNREKEQMLINFIKTSLSKGHQINKIRNALIEKRWPPTKVDEVIREILKSGVQETKKEKPGGGPKTKKIFLYFLWFIIISVVLALGIAAYSYIQATHSYTIQDPNTGQLVTGNCLQEDCSDMREYIYEQILDNIIIIAIIGLGVSLILVLLHVFIPHKEIIIWVGNILFLLYILYLLYLWFFT